MRKTNPIILVVIAVIFLTLLGLAGLNYYGIMGFGPKTDIAGAQILRTLSVRGHYLVETDKGTFEVDTLSREGLDHPYELFKSLKTEQFYNFTVLGHKQSLLGRNYLPYILTAEVAKSTLPPQFRQKLQEAGYDNIPNTSLWVQWVNHSLVQIEGSNYTVLVGPAP